MPQADAHHAASANNALTTTRTRRRACRSPHRSRMLTSLPGLTSRSRATRHKHTLQGERNPCTRYSMGLRDGKRPKPHSQSTRTHRKTTHAASPSRSEAPGAKWRRTLLFSRRRSSPGSRTFTGGRFYRPRKVKFASNTALAHPRGVADRMFLVRCDFPPRPAACGA
jgi:hypothetical protein